MGPVCPDGSSDSRWVQSVQMGTVRSDGCSQAGWVQSVQMVPVSPAWFSQSGWVQSVWVGPVSPAWMGLDDPVCVCQSRQVQSRCVGLIWSALMGPGQFGPLVGRSGQLHQPSQSVQCRQGSNIEIRKSVTHYSSLNISFHPPGIRHPN